MRWEDQKRLAHKFRTTCMGECAAGSENRIGLNFSRNAGLSNRRWWRFSRRSTNRSFWVSAMDSDRGVASTMHWTPWPLASRRRRSAGWWTPTSPGSLIRHLDTPLDEPAVVIYHHRGCLYRKSQHLPLRRGHKAELLTLAGFELFKLG